MTRWDSGLRGSRNPELDTELESKGMLQEIGEVLAIIPARGGSKGIPRKNLAKAGDKTLLAWAVEAARLSRSCTRVVVTTDSEEIAAEAERCGAEVPFLRPPELAADDTPGIAPLIHAVRWLGEYQGYLPEWVVALQPTSPLRTAADVDAALQLAVSRAADAVVSVTPAPTHPFLAKAIDSEGLLRDLLPGTTSITRRQDLPEAFLLNGAVYATRRSNLLARETFYGERTCGYVMPPERSIDVDSEWDLYLTRVILQNRDKFDANG